MIATGERRTIDVPDAAAQLGCSRRHLYALIARDEFPAIRLGKRRVVIPRVAFEELLDSWRNQDERAS